MKWKVVKRIITTVKFITVTVVVYSSFSLSIMLLCALVSFNSLSIAIMAHIISFIVLDSALLLHVFDTGVISDS